VERTIELEGDVYADLDAEDRPLGLLEFIALTAFDECMRRHGTLSGTERVLARSPS
jgi:hypothetical protein